MDAPTQVAPSKTALAEWAHGWLARQPLEPHAVFVRGAGPHADAIHERLPRALVVSHGDAGAERHEPLRIHTSACPYLGTLARRTMTLALEVFRADPPEELVPASPAPPSFTEMLSTCRRSALVEQGTLSSLAGTWLDNLERNLPRVMHEPSVAAVGRRVRAPVVVAGAGPSLERVLPALAELRRRALVLAASSALRPLVRAGIEPDGVVMIEGRDCRHHFEGIPSATLGRLALFAESTTCPAHLELPFARTYFFHGSPGAWLEPWSGRGSLLPTGGNVGTAALVLAWMLGGDPVMMAGLDFALAGERYYTKGSGSRPEEHDGHETETVAGWSGEPLCATPELACYREQTEDVIRAIVRRDTRARFVALSPKGARVDGATAEDAARLARALAPLPVRPSLEPDRAAVPAGQGPEVRREAAERMEDLARRAAGRVAGVADDPRGPGIALVTLRPADTLPMILAGPGIIAAHRSAGGERAAVRRAVRDGLSRFEGIVAGALARTR